MKIAYAIMKFSRLSVLSVIFHQVFSLGSNDFSSEIKAKDDCSLLCTEKTYGQ